MSSRAVKMVANYEDAKKELLDKMPVAFVVYDPDASSKSVSEEQYAINQSGMSDEEKVAERTVLSTERMTIFGQAARKMQAQGSFGLISPGVPREDVAEFFSGDAASMPTGGFIARIEEEVPTRIYAGELSMEAVVDFVKEQNLAVVIELGGHNFRFASRRGKALAVAAYDPNDEVRTERFKREVKRYAVGGAHRDDYVFGTMDGRRWDKFLNQFSIEGENLPELFVLDVPSRTYWQDASVFGVAEFIAAVKNDEIPSREQEKPKSSPLDQFFQAFVDYMPYSLLGMLALFAFVFWLALPRIDDGAPL